MGKQERKQKKKRNDGVLPVILGIFIVATAVVFLILVVTLLDRNGTIDRWKTQYSQWKEAREAQERAKHAGEKTVHVFGASGVAEYDSWFAGTWMPEGEQKETKDLEKTETQVADPLRQTLTKSPVNGIEVWWKEVTKLSGEVFLYAQADTPLYAAPEENGTVYGRAAAGEKFRLFGVFADGWYVVTDGCYYYCSRGEHYTMVQPEQVDFAAIFAACETKAVFHEVEELLQKPELPHGCEVTALAMLLRYYGYAADKCVLAEEWLPKGNWGETDFRKAFVGNPRKSYGSAGCYAEVIADTANRYVKDAEGTKTEKLLTATAEEEVSFVELLTMVEKAPVIAWMTMELNAPYIAQVWTVEGEELYWQNYEHCVVLTGYDLEKGVFYGQDPLYGACAYDMKLFYLRFQTMFSQIVRLE